MKYVEHIVILHDPILFWCSAELRFCKRHIFIIMGKKQTNVDFVYFENICLALVDENKAQKLSQNLRLCSLS